MAHAQGMSETIRIGFEASFKTLPGTVTADKVPAIANLRPTRNKFSSQTLTGSPEPRATVFGKVGVEGDVKAECTPDSMYPWLKGLYGAPTTSGTASLYAHRFSLGTMLSMFLEAQHADLTKFFLYKGLYVGSGSFQFPTEGVMEASFGVRAALASAATGATVINGTVTDRTTLRGMSYLYGRIKRNGTAIAYVKLATLDVNRRLGSDTAIDETNELAVIFSEIAEVGGRMTALFTESTLYDDSLAGTEVSMEIWVPYGSGKGYLVYFPAVILDPFSVVTNGTGLVTLDGGYTAQPTGSTKGKVFSKFFSDEALDGLTLSLKPDGGASQVVTFAATDNTPEEAMDAVNAQTTGVTASLLRMTGETGAVLVIETDTAGSAGSIQVEAASTGDTTLGFDNTVHSGLTSVSHEVFLFNTVA